MAGKHRSEKDEVVFGTGNVFADLSFADADERQTKLRLGHVINQIIAQRALTQSTAAVLLKVNQPKISALLPTSLMVFPWNG